MEAEVVSDGTGTRLVGGSGRSILYGAACGKYFSALIRFLLIVIQVSFGVAPAAVAFAIGIRTPVDHLLLAFFVLCGLTRLARFNVTAAVLPKDKTGKSKYFEGTPIPTTLSIASVMAYWVSQGWILDDIPLGVVAQGTQFEFHPVALMFVLHGCLMVSKTIHIPKP